MADQKKSNNQSLKKKLDSWGKRGTITTGLLFSKEKMGKMSLTT